MSNSPQYLRRIITIRAEDSPNVILQRDDAIDGVLTYTEYLYRRRTWDAIRQKVGLDAEFYEGASVLMFPPDWLDRAEAFDWEASWGESSPRFRSYKDRRAVGGVPALGIDPAEGGDDSAWTVADGLGILEADSLKTPNTSIVWRHTYSLMEKWKIPPERVCFDRGGGGKWAADELRKKGHNVRTVAFGEPISPEPRPRGNTPGLPIRKDERETRYVFKNRRAQMYFLIRWLIDPSREATEADPVREMLGHAARRAGNPASHTGLPPGCIRFGIGKRYVELRRQLAPIPLTYDPEERLYLLPKHKKSEDSPEPTLTDIIGCSPDEADSLALAVFALLVPDARPVAGRILSGGR